MDVYVEAGQKRAFAVSLEWPGWCRRGRDEEEALRALVEAAPRYATTLGTAAQGFRRPDDASDVRVVERVPGDATTDFGAPSKEISSDDRTLEPVEAERLTERLVATWAAFDRAVKRHAGATLRKGPRGGGRELDAIVRHVLEADAAYLRSVGGKHAAADDADDDAELQRLRTEITEALAARARGEPLPPRRGRVWTPRYFIRRSAWHAIDHAWEIADRAS